MVLYVPIDCEQSDVAMPTGTAIKLSAPRTNNAGYSMNRSARRAIQSRTRQVANGWSKKERADRLGAGIARLTWLSTLVDQT